MQQLLLQKDVPANCIDGKNLDDYLYYVQYLTSTEIKDRFTFGDAALDQYHHGKSILLNNKYLFCAVPSVSLQFLLESHGIMDYGAVLDGFKHKVCSHSIDGSDFISDVFSPNIKGDHYNPYIRYNSAIAAASRSCRHLFNLSGLEFPDFSCVNPHKNVFLDIVCTFPFEISILLVDPKMRGRAMYGSTKNGKRSHKKVVHAHHIIDRMDRCRSRFFAALNDIIAWDPDHHAGMSSSLHVWSSAIPFLPHGHIHCIVPFFSYLKNVVRVPFFSEDDITFFDYYADAAELAKYVIDVAVGDGTAVDGVAVKRVASGTRKVHRSKVYGSLGGKSTHNVDVPVTHRYVVDRDLYKDLRSELSRVLSGSLGFRGVEWFDPGFPVDAAAIKKIWSDIVRAEFQEFDFAADAVYDVHLEFVNWYDQSKLQHKLKYKCRPPVLDLDLFFKKLDGDFVRSYSELDVDVLFNYLHYQLEVAVKCSNYNDITRFESYIEKLSCIVDRFSMSDMYSWLQFLSTWVTDTRVYGFWRSLKHYVLDPLDELLVLEDVCPVCDGSIIDLGADFAVDSCIVDFVFVQHNAVFLVFDPLLSDGG